jgi:hypothetical protein
MPASVARIKRAIAGMAQECAVRHRRILAIAPGEWLRRGAGRLPRMLHGSEFDRTTDARPFIVAGHIRGA